MERNKNAYRARVFFLMSATIFGSILHFYDNYVNLPLYAMPTFIHHNPWIIPLYWFVMTIVGLLAWYDAVYEKPKHFLYTYSLMAMFSYGHYWAQPIWSFQPYQNVMILGETIPATFLFLAAYFH